MSAEFFLPDGSLGGHFMKSRNQAATPAQRNPATAWITRANLSKAVGCCSVIYLISLR